MARTTTLTGVITLATKQIVLTEQISIREQVNLHITGTGTAVANDLIAAIIFDGSLMALVQPLVDYTTYIGGVLDLNTTEIVAIFSGMSANTRRKCSFVIWDTTNECTLVNDWIWVQNNPYDSSMETPTAVDPIGGVLYAPIAKGVDNGNNHDHNGGDGADISDRFLLRVPPGANFRVSADGLTIEHKDVVLGTWHTFVLANGSYGPGPAL